MEMISHRDRATVARNAPAMRAQFWADKESNGAHAATIDKPGKLEIAAALSHRTAEWSARYERARTVLRVINGGRV